MRPGGDGKPGRSGSIARAETIGREVPVRFVEQGTLVERRIDRLIRENGRETVIDYKSGIAEEERVEKDRVQIERYCRAISDITGRECSGLLWYIDLDTDVAIRLPSLASLSRA